jgi:hypothetical protein
MPTEAFTMRAAALPPRAGIALLTLQLRASLHEAAAAEAEAAEIDCNAALAQLRAKLGPVVEERRRALDEALTHVRAEADAAVASACSEASAIVADVATSASHLTPTSTNERSGRSDIWQLVLQLSSTRRAAAEAEADEGALDPDRARSQLVALVGPLVEERRRVLNAELAAARSEAAAAVALAQRQAAIIVAGGREHDAHPSPQSNLVVDAHVAAEVFATILAKLLDERFTEWRNGGSVVPASLSEPARQSFWSHAWHLDALLSGLAVVIVLVILAAWLA